MQSGQPPPVPLMARRTQGSASALTFWNSARAAAAMAGAPPSRPRAGMALRTLRSPGAAGVRYCSTAGGGGGGEVWGAGAWTA